MEKIAVVILNWNGEKLLRRFLPKVIEHSGSADIYLIDNCSTDGSIQLTEWEFKKVNVIPLEKNFGFAEGYNLGLRQIEADLFVLLNSDVEVTSGWIEPVLEVFRQDEQVAACQPLILDLKRPEWFEHAGAAGGYVDRLGYMFCAGRIFNEFERNEGQYSTNREVFWASGACLFVRRSCFFEAGGFDSDFFAHMEEIDLCWRLKNMGYSVWACGYSSVYHVGGASLNSAHPQKVFLNFRNNLYLLTKNASHAWPVVLILKRMLLDGIAALKFLFEGKFLFFFAVFHSHISFWFNVRSMVKKRIQSDALKTNLTGIYRGSIITDFFLRGKRTFDQLDPGEFH